MRASRTVPLLQRAPEGGWWGCVPALPGVYGQGTTRSAAQDSVMSALADALATYRAMNQAPPFRRLLLGR
jgi:predicted RNase H-like HicB family nuclease